ncbi:unnamed protein product [Orchesella dallaii]|uniref:Uncharacterized protein n=1 Tax=Orchesella dallaii TaxID=48710 RepID=A0ABP1QZD2_9HEXA
MNTKYSNRAEDTYTVKREEKLQEEFNPSTTRDKGNKAIYAINYYADAMQRALNETDPDVVLDIVIETSLSERLQIAKAYNQKYANVARNDDENDVKSLKLRVADAAIKLISETQKSK